MRKVYTAADRVDAQLCCDYLSQRGVSVYVQGMNLQGAVGELPPDLPVTLWVIDDRDEALARQLIGDYQTPLPQEAQDWYCRQCGERIEAQFALCWKCGSRLND